MMTARTALAGLILTAGCSGGGDSPRDRCTRVATAICDTFVRCHAAPHNEPITQATCDAVNPGLVDDCVARGADDIGAATDEKVDACVEAFENFACADLCNQVAQDPPVCHTPSDEPNTEVITCQ
jgi:hypothetical protein